MRNFIVGQRWISEAEPELGLGIICEVLPKTVNIEFRNSETTRVYGLKTAPLKRVEFQPGDKVQSVCQTKKFTVERVEVVDELLVYIGEEDVLCEVDICHSLSFNRPQDKLFNNLSSPLSLFDLRSKTSACRQVYERSPVKGLLGGRMSLLPHQFYVASKVINEPLPRVLFADEVGLGKTIEAGLVLHNLIKTNRVERALILVPDSLVYQWFFEMRKKFNLNFQTINQESYLEKGTNPFKDSQFSIASLDLLRGAEMARELLKQSDFDLIIVDEAHQLKWTKEGPDLAFQVVEEVASRTPMTFLLTATPEQLGEMGHFARLKLLDSNRFYDYEAFKKESANYHAVAEEAKEILSKGELTENDKESLRSLLDRHGTGRILYRNTRANLQNDYDFFPKRILNSYSLNSKPEGDYRAAHNLDDLFFEKANWLVEFLTNNNNEKALLICRSKKKVLELEEYIRKNSSSIKTGVFHSDLSLMARDRQAAYFVEADGAQVLLCTEIGSEGRNFEFCHHLILFDLPISADLLEQRIGRLDRIGQKSDIQIHVPFAKDSYESVLLEWFHEGLNAFEKSCKVGSKVLSEVKIDLAKALENENQSHDLIEKTKTLRLALEEELEKGRDQLIEYNSYQHDQAYEIVKNVRAMDNSSELYSFLDLVFHSIGVDVEEIEPFVTFIKPSDNMYIPHFPGLPSDGMRITFDRRVALEREDVSFISWDHPMVQGIMELIESEGLGNVSVVTRKGGKPGKVFLECFFKLSALTKKGVDTSRYLPTQTIRVLVNPQGEDFSEKFPKELLDEKVMDSSAEQKMKASKFPKDKVEQALDQARSLALSKAETIKENAKKEAVSALGQEISRLEELQKINPSVRSEEIEFSKIALNEVLNFIEISDIQLDSIRVVV